MATLEQIPLTDRPDDLVQTLAAVWEDSVRATHDFLTEDDIVLLRPHVRTALRDIPSLTVARDEADRPVGFMGVADGKIEMLFLAPSARGNGLGRRLVEYAVSGGNADRLDVNEQNVQAVGFYKHLGFTVVGRSPVDGMGLPFPLLHLAHGGTEPPAP
ncbi:MAG: acetyltransferase [Planctomycetes bacterium]|nr:acetyltransferase [Planctomycetota bacterium]MCD7896422.1 acetyltransferase [Planctomycetaceae bacterium]